MKWGGQVNDHPLTMLFFDKIDEKVVIIGGIRGKRAGGVTNAEPNVTVAVLESDDQIGLVVATCTVIQLLKAHKLYVRHLRIVLLMHATGGQDGAKEKDPPLFHLKMS